MTGEIFFFRGWGGIVRHKVRLACCLMYAFCCLTATADLERGKAAGTGVLSVSGVFLSVSVSVLVSLGCEVCLQSFCLIVCPCLAGE